MNKNIKRSLLRSLGLNFLAGIVGVLPFIFLKEDAFIVWGFMLFIIAILSLITQLIVGIVYVNRPEKKERGQGMLLSLGIILLIGIAICTPFWL